MAPRGTKGKLIFEKCIHRWGLESRIDEFVHYISLDKPGDHRKDRDRAIIAGCFRVFDFGNWFE